jgi:hypothetical protein
VAAEFSDELPIGRIGQVIDGAGAVDPGQGAGRQVSRGPAFEVSEIELR